MTQNFAGIYEPMVCPPGHYCNLGGKQITTCPSGYFCPLGTVDPLRCGATSICLPGADRELVLEGFIVIFIVDFLILAFLFKPLWLKLRRKSRDALTFYVRKPTPRVNTTSSRVHTDDSAETPDVNEPWNDEDLTTEDDHVQGFTTSVRSCVGQTEIGLSFGFENISLVLPNGKTILAPQSGNIPKGTIWGVMGPSGAGKSSLVNVLMGKTTPTEGKIYVNNVVSRVSSALNYTTVPQIGLLASLAIGLAAAAPGVKTFGEEKQLYWRETSAGHSRSAYFLGKIFSTIPRLVISALHFTTFYCILATPLMPFWRMYLTNLMYFYCIYGLASAVSTAVRRENGPLLAMIVSLIIGVFGGYGPPLYNVREWHLEWLWRICPGIWLTEAYFNQHLIPLGHLYDLDAAAIWTGYIRSRFGVDIVLLLVIGTVYRAATFIGLTMFNLFAIYFTISNASLPPGVAGPRWPSFFEAPDFHLNIAKRDVEAVLIGDQNAPGPRWPTVFEAPDFHLNIAANDIIDILEPVLGEAWAAQAGEDLKKDLGGTVLRAIWDVARAGAVMIPGLIWGPALNLLGFGMEGVGRGTAAAAMQSAIGTVAAYSPFAFLQSAGAGGYGATAMDTLTRGAVLAFKGGRWIVRQLNNTDA
ncbi:hypothetical protein NUW58_g3506 [Xylaria curta]|uniref:Uncharacterized protein n=1 Tax=Xylaria curta TaxID=42375 RepID=A0ACC1PDC6_9PEZI|nr:hypothetical protein NUW58_g3506 [Xylaria curta]